MTPTCPAHVFEEQHAKSLSIDEVLKVSDYVTIHMPLTDETRNLFNAKSIAEMKDGAVVLNMARGGIVNEKDMYEAPEVRQAGRLRLRRYGERAGCRRPDRGRWLRLPPV